MSDVWFRAIGFDKTRQDLWARFSPGESYLGPEDIEVEVRVNRDPGSRGPQSRDYVIRQDCQVEVRSPRGEILDVVTGAERLKVINAISVTLLNSQNEVNTTTAARLREAVHKVSSCAR